MPSTPGNERPGTSVSNGSLSDHFRMGRFQRGSDDATNAGRAYNPPYNDTERTFTRWWNRSPFPGLAIHNWPGRPYPFPKNHYLPRMPNGISMMVNDNTTKSLSLRVCSEHEIAHTWFPFYWASMTVSGKPRAV